MREQPSIATKSLRRVYRTGQGVVEALKGLDLEVPSGGIFCLLGPNGAGKTTLIKILVTLLSPTSGKAFVDGHDVSRDSLEVRREVGFVLGGDRGLYPRLSAIDNLRYFGALWGLSRRQTDERAAVLLNRFRLENDAHRRVEQFSRGMRQKLHLARGMLTEPKILFLDEPTIGLDPLAARDLREFIKVIGEHECTILLTTHYLAEAEELANGVAVISSGELVFNGSVAEMKALGDGGDEIVIELSSWDDSLRDNLDVVDGITSIAVHSNSGGLHDLTIRCKEAPKVAPDVLRIVAARGYWAESVALRRTSLEDAYLQILRGRDS